MPLLYLMYLTTMLLRATIIGQHLVISIPQDFWKGYFASIMEDSILCTILITTFYITKLQKIQHSTLSLICKILAVSIISLYLLDFFIILTFQQHLTLEHFMIFNFQSIESFFNLKIGKTIYILLVVTTVLMFISFNKLLSLILPIQVFKKIHNTQINHVIFL